MRAFFSTVSPAVQSTVLTVPGTSARTVLLSSPARDLIFSCWSRISSAMLCSSTPVCAAERLLFSCAVFRLS